MQSHWQYQDARDDFQCGLPFGGNRSRDRRIDFEKATVLLQPIVLLRLRIVL